MFLKHHLVLCCTLLILTAVSTTVVDALPCGTLTQDVCDLSHLITNIFLWFFSIGLIITLTSYFFVGISKRWSYVKTYMFALCTYVLIAPFYYLLFIFLLPLILKVNIHIT